jgi:oligopeptide transport system substrate-binding protein
VLHIFGRPPEEKDRLRRHYPQQYSSGPLLVSPVSIAFNVTRPPFDDPRVRRALVHAVDREGFASDVLHDTFTAALGGFVPPGMAGYSPGIGLPYDPELARQLLADAGYPHGRGFPALEEPWLLGVHRNLLIDYVQPSWSHNLGIDVRLVPTGWTEYREMMATDPPRLFFHPGWFVDYPDPDNLLRVGFPWHWTGWRNEVYDSLVERARRLMDQDERIRLYRQADQILIQDAAIMPLIYWRSHVLIKPWVTAFPLSASGRWDAKDIVIEPH